MSRKSWRKNLATALARLTPAEPRVAIVGLGSELHGDDAAGVLVARALRRRRAPSPTLLILEGGAYPENYSGVLRRFAPDLLLFVDAAPLGLPSGAVRWLALDALDACGVNSHAVPLLTLAEYVGAPESALVGIQPERLDFGALPTPRVRRVARDVARALAEGLAAPSPVSG